MLGKGGFLYRLRRQMQIYLFHLTNPAFVSKLYFRQRMSYRLNLQDPKTFNEKIQWLKLNYWPDHPMAIQCGDKYAVRSYIEKQGMGEYLNDLLFVWDRVEDIQWDLLPEKFAMKCTHGCAYNIICSEKSKLDIPGTEKKLRRWMKQDYGKFNAETHYSKIKPRIIVEKFLDEDLTDYKFFICNGQCKFMYVSTGWGEGVDVRVTFFDEYGKLAKFRRIDYPILEDAKLPTEYEKMRQLSIELAKDLPFVRVDWFAMEGKIYFSEMTFTPCGGAMKMETIEQDKNLGEMLDISELLRK